MSSQFCAPTLFRASAMASPGDEDVCPGTHVRVWLDGEHLFPLHPLLVMPALEFSHREVRFTGFYDGGTTTSAFDPASLGPVTLVLDPVGPPSLDPWISWVKLEGGGELRLDLLDNKGRLVGSRSPHPWAVSGSNITQVRVDGSGVVETVHVIDAGEVAQLHTDEPVVELSLPLEGTRWYRHGLGAGEALTRAVGCAPRRFGPHDDPEQSSIGDPEGDEDRRVSAIASSTLDPWLERAFNGQDPPTALFLPPDPAPGQKGSTTVKYLTALLAAGADAGIARYLGLLGTIPGGPNPNGLWLVGGIFAVDPSHDEVVRLAGLKQDPSELQTAFAQLVRGDDGGSGRYPEVFDVERQAKDMGLVTRAFVTPVASAEPLDLPSVIGPRRAAARWNTTPTGTWTQDIEIENTPTGPLAAVRRYPDGLPLHQPLEGTDGPRRAVMIAGRNQRGLVTVTDLAVSTVQATWAIWYGDEFGRWGPESEAVEGSEPERPRPDPPALEPWFLSNATPAAGTAAASPGTINVRVEVPDPAQRAPGMLPFTELRLSVDGAATSHLPQPDVISIDAPPTVPGGHADVVITGTLRNATGESEPAVQKLRVHDPRPPRALVAAPGVVWTSRPDAAGGAELALSWTVQERIDAYRVYLADEHALARDVAVPVGASRAKRAALLVGSPGANDKARFQLLTDPPERPAAGARSMTYSYRLPGRLAGVVFAKVVPVTDGWVEAPFAGSGLVPVAVPSVDTPPAPVLRVENRADGTAVIEIRASGVDPARLEQLGGAPPEWRLRRAPAATAAPEYARLVDSGPLVAGAGSSEWSAVVEVEARPAFVQETWYAEVRYPAEPGVDGNPDIVLSDRTVRPAWGTPGAPVESLWSPPSLSATSFHDSGPPKPPSASVGFFIDEQDPARLIIVDPAPVAAAHAPAPYRLAAWRLPAGAEPELVVPPDQAAIDDPLYVLHDPIGAPRYRVALVDPLDRWSDAIEITV